jgi:hypothetical protein
MRRFTHDMFSLRTIMYINRATAVHEDEQQSACERYMRRNDMTSNEWVVRHEVDDSTFIRTLMESEQTRRLTIVTYSAETIFNGPMLHKSMLALSRRFRIMCVNDRLDTGGLRITTHTYMRSLACMRSKRHDPTSSSPKYGTFTDDDGVTHINPEEAVSLGVIMTLRKGLVKTSKIAEILNDAGLYNPRSDCEWKETTVTSVCVGWGRPMRMEHTKKLKHPKIQTTSMRDCYDPMGNQRPINLCFY